MYLVDLTIRTNTAGTFHLHTFGDMHCDRKEFDDARFKQQVRAVAADPLAVAIFPGDYLDGRIPGRKFFDADTVRDDFLGNLKSYVNHGLDVLDGYISPLVAAGVPIVLVSGNHDEYLEEIGLTHELARRLARHCKGKATTVHYLGAEGFVRIQSGRPGAKYTTVVYARHGSGGGKRPGGKVNAMQSELEYIDADVVVEGHVHDGDIRILDRYGVQRAGALALQQRKVALVRAPGYVRRAVPGSVGYQGKKGFPSTDMGLQYLRIAPRHGSIVRVEHEF